MKTLFLDY